MKNIGFCMECNKDTEYTLKKIVSKQMIKGKEYKIKSSLALCNICGEEMNIPGLMDRNLKQEDEQLRVSKKLITNEEIGQLMELYNIGKAPLSLALGFGEVTIARYLDGQMPSQTYSEIMLNALSSFEYMERLLKRNQDKLANTAYQKSLKQIEKYKKMNKISNELQMCVSYVYKKNPDITIYSLHKLLYFMQGLHMAIYGEKMFEETPVATEHGPVYKELFDFMKDFHYNLFEDPRFHFFEKQYKGLTDDKKDIIQLVLDTFGIYSGSTLESIIKKEVPWIHAREISDETELDQKISDSEMQRYYMWVVRKFSINNVEHMNHYINYKLQY